MSSKLLPKIDVTQEEHVKRGSQSVHRRQNESEWGLAVLSETQLKSDLQAGWIATGFATEQLIGSDSIVESRLNGKGRAEVKRKSVQANGRTENAEHSIGSCRREIFDHVIAMNEPHPRRLICDYVAYH